MERLQRHSLFTMQENRDRRQDMEQEMTVEELIALINVSGDNFMIQIAVKEDADERREQSGK
jgi:hypothetical protein